MKALDDKTFQHGAEGAVRPGAARARQAGVERAVHHAQAGRRDAGPGKQISEHIGSGPFIFKKDEWKPGDKAVYVRNPDYKPRTRAAVGPGRRQGRQGRPGRMALRSPTPQTAVNALLAGEIDLIEAPPHDLLPLLEGRQERQAVATTRSATSTCSA